MVKQKKTWAIVFIVIGCIMLFGRWVTPLSIVALLVLCYGIYTMRAGRALFGYKCLALGAGLLVLDHMILLLGGILISIGVFYARAKELHQERKYIRRQEFVSQFHHTREPWVPEPISLWHLFGDTHCDFSLALPTDGDPTIHVQGVICDGDFTFPEEYAVEIEVFIGYGKVNFEGETHSGMLNKFVWRSPNYAYSDQKVKIVMAYAAGNVNIRFN
ncbi:cell wall-active antibiotics response protein LiaF [Saccharibacillus sp. JS10]|uniref:cell wall-active antibiotics response protein LiaF n=1 Tax=Saccharibacillus sp. JS10 TaxID=2950552 RepID=UPI00210DBFC1|nr:cell wall-active antibiotics response protein LiaF [Saccharibacillus sp. JS10]MCQ4088518.1 cell wall-active antibiotics response protein LiaF [Saccharibacillus sp. JS10]